MTLRGKIKNGKVLLDDPRALPEGTEVVVRPVPRPKSASQGGKRKAKAPRQSLAERLGGVKGKATGLPADASANHDHYLYGAAKRP